MSGLQSIGSPNVNESSSVQDALNGDSAGAAGTGNLFNSAGSTLGTAGSLFGIANGIQSGRPTGYAGAALSSAALANKAGAFGGSSSAAGSGIQGASNVLGLYSGIKQGGAAGYAQAANSAYGLATGSAGIPVVGQALSVYNFAKNWQSGDTGGDALRGAEMGASIGSVVPVIGTVVGALIGGAVGAISSAFGNGKVDPENANFEGFTKAYNAASTPAQKAQVAGATSNPYLPLAGLFDLRSNQIKGNIPIVSQYGRKGEQQFTTDMFAQMNKALSNGTISKSASTPEIMAKVVQPWIDGFGKGKMTDSNSDAINAMIGGLVDDYRTGNTSQLKAIGGDTAFGNLPAFGGGPQAAAPSSAPAVGNLRFGLMNRQTARM